MNSSFPDYDFTETHPDCFHVMKESEVMHTVNSYLGEISMTKPNFLINLWQAINDVVSLQDCIIFSYVPDSGCQGHPFAGCLWSFNFFFFNKELKRICYFTCMGSNQKVHGHVFNGIDDDDDEEEYVGSDMEMMSSSETEEY
jgi:hypothetical protein